jgi:PPP family 3-phenylpropionic acid transporter
MRWLRVLYLANGAIYGTFYAFVPVVLTWHGFDAPLVAICGSLGSLAFWLVLPAWGHLGDAVVGTRRALQLAAVPAAVLCLGLALPLPVLPILLLCVAGSATGGAIGALTDAQAVSGLADPQREYGRLRMLGSLGAGVFAILSGVLYDRTGYIVAPVAGALATIAIAFIAVRIPQGHGGRAAAETGSTSVGSREAVPAAGHGRFGSVSDALNGRPRLIAILVGCLGIFIGIMGSGTFITLRLQALGGGPSTIGFANGLGASAEVPGMILASWLIVRYGIRPVLGLCALGLALVFGTWALVTEPLLITATKMAAGLFFAGVTVSFVITMATILPQRLISTGQTLYQSVAFGAAAVLSNLAGAFIYKLGGTEVVFWFLAAATAVGGVISILALPAHTRVSRVTVEPSAVELGAGGPVVVEPGAIEPRPVVGS